ncbi:hypothetical protein VMCG_02397 [Cytospora schulzeri]|uniref:Zn(2)-C6 fungal-type domain-containing protein n=1 Tax=Cytospora schulzeri TaxID=448051 RepID=A0A423X0S7_9PEZI|nr:hypothetical protein VMCG_02397 [Valsa malicola]
MDDFLDAPKSTYTCGSVDDLTLHLGGLREQRVTDARAEHISATFEFRPSVVFNVPETENDAVDPQNFDPALGGIPGAAPAAPMNGGASPATREIRAHDTLMNQPTDDPALQKLVAKHIITSLGNVDGSSWIVRSVSRNSSGWTFTYICKNSTQSWMRQNSKNAAKLRVGESSGKDGQDPVNLARPAFDCRGSVTIAFVKNNRMITVKLEHTTIHMTVAELAELFKPPPPPPRAEVGRRKEGESNKRKTQAPNGVDNGEDGSRKKRKKKSANPDDPSAEGEQAPKPKRPRPSKARKPKGADALTQADAQQNSLLNLSPSEAARRKDEATRKLQDAGIDPETLSTEQFDIFANQSPDLQTESLAMLVKYGAERLRIVHPNKDNAPQPDGAAPINGSTPDGSTRKKKKSRKSESNGDGTPKVKKTRGSCQSCRERKTKCSKAKPECQECVQAGLSCYYPPEQKRKSMGVKLAEMAEDEFEGPAQEHVPEPAPEPVPEPAPEPAIEQVAETTAEEEASDLGSPGFDTSHAPAPEALSQQVDNSTNYPVVNQDVSHDLYQPAPSGLSYPPGVSEDMSAGTDYFQQQPASSSISYSHQTHQPPSVAYPDPISAASQQVAQPETVPETVQAVLPPPTRSTSSRSSARRTLPSGSAHNPPSYPNSAIAGHAAASWQPTNVTAETTQPYSVSPTMSKIAPSPRQSRSKPTAASSTYEASQQEGLASATALSQAALQKAHPSPTARKVSPFQNPTQAARAKSRQGQRSQSRQTASPFQHSSAQPTPLEAPAIYNTSAATDSNSLSSYDQYSRYNTATTQPSQPSSRVAYEPYSQQTTSNNSSTPYPSYDAYNSRSHAPTSSSLANPVTQSMSSSYTKTAAPSSNSWSNATNGRNNSSYSSNRAAASSTPDYNVPASTAQQQPVNVQSFNTRPPSTVPQSSRSNTTTPSSYAQQPRQQQQQPYSSYSSQSHSTPTQQPQQPPAPQQDWYGYGSTNNATSNYGSGPYSQHRSMNVAGNTYSSINDQEALYEMLRNNPRH